MLHCYYQNVRSIRTRFTVVEPFALSCGLDILALTETWLNDSVTDFMIAGDSYLTFRRDRDPAISSRSRGGVLLLIKHYLHPLLIDELSVSHHSFESVAVRICLHGKRFLICAVYFAPQSNAASFEYFFELLWSLNSLDLIPLILGDFNVPICANSLEFVHNDVRANSLNSLFSLHDVTQHNYISNESGRILDFILCSSDITVTRSSSSLVNEDGHHPSLDITINVSPQRASPSAVPSASSSFDLYDFSKADFLGLYRSLSMTDWSPLYHLELPAAFSFFYSVIYQNFSTFVPLRRNRLTSLRSSPWITRNILRLMSIRDRHRRRWLRSGCRVFFRKYRLLRSRIKNLIKLSRRAYFTSRENMIASNPRLFWSHVNSLMGKQPSAISLLDDSGDIVSDPPTIAELFSSHFSRSFGSQSSTPAVPSFPDGNFISPELNCFSLSDLSLAVKKLKSTRVIPVDGIPSFIVKGCFNSFSSPLLYLFNAILDTGFFPEEWRVAIISPIYKGKGSRLSVDSYRPIAILSSLFRLFELAVLEAVRPIISNLLSESQHGFCRGRSTITNLLCLKSRILDVFEKRSQLDVIYFDFSKAFDVLRPDLLVNKLLTFGLSSPFVYLLSQFFTGRFFSVRVSGYVSPSSPIFTGVPQGSSFGPLLFSLFINDLLDASSVDTLLLYADDVKLLLEITQPQDCAYLQSLIDNLYAWSVRNHISLNISKCNVVTYTKKSFPLLYDYKIADHLLSRVEVIKDLGVFFSATLNFRPHIRHVVSRVNRLIGLIARAFSHSSSPLLFVTLWKTLIVPLVSYGITVWYPWQSSLRTQLEGTRRRFLRVLQSTIYGSHGVYYSLEDLERLYGVYSLEYYFKRSTFLFYTKLIRGLVHCPYLLGRVDFSCINPRHRLRVLFRDGHLRLFHHFDNIHTFYSLVNASLDRLDIFTDDPVTLLNIVLH